MLIKFSDSQAAGLRRDFGGVSPPRLPTQRFDRKKKGPKYVTLNVSKVYEDAPHLSIFVGQSLGDLAHVLVSR
jgi:hypothetical protein